MLDGTDGILTNRDGLNDLFISVEQFKNRTSSVTGYRVGVAFTRNQRGNFIDLLE